MSSESDAAALPTCINCGAQQSGAYCPRCGQRQATGRHTLRRLLLGIADRLFNTEAGLVRTIVEMTLRPGVMIREYLAGRTIRYMHPASYLLVSAGVFALVSNMLGGATGSGDEGRIFALLLIPFVAAASRVLFWRGRYNYAEHLIGVMYLSAHVLLVLTVLYLAVPFISSSSLLRLYVIASLTIAAAYFLWSYSSLFPGRSFLAILAGVAALTFGGVAWLIAVMLLVNLLGS